MKMRILSPLPYFLALSCFISACQSEVPGADNPLLNTPPQGTAPITAPSAQPRPSQSASARPSAQATTSPKPASQATAKPAASPSVAVSSPKPITSPRPAASPVSPQPTAAPTGAAPVTSGNNTEVITSANYNTATLVAGLHLDQNRAAAEAIAQRHNLTIERYNDSIKIVVYNTHGQNVPDLLKALSGEAALEYVEADQVASQKPEDEKAVSANFQTQAALNDTYYAQQYGLQAMNVPAAWELSQGKDVVVAVIDTGVDLDHPDLKGRVVPGYDAFSQQEGEDAGDVSSLNYVVSSYKHGSHVAGIIAAEANNGKGIAGVAPEAKIMPIKIFADLSDIIKSLWAKEEDTSYTIISILADGIVWAADHGADVINMSLAVTEDSATIDRAVKYALSKNISVIVAAGNDRHLSNNRNYLAAIAGVVGVGATDENNAITFFSNSGDYVSVAAPGLDIISTVPSFLNFNSYVKMSGTSMAAPAVAGVAALMKAKYGAQATPAFIKSRLEQTAVDKGDPGRDDLFGFGIVNARAALEN
jgi:type VII secretion-associated serine protease mycosin